MGDPPELNWLKAVCFALFALFQTAGAWQTRPVPGNAAARTGTFAHAAATALMMLWFSCTSAMRALGQEVPLLLLPVGALTIVAWAVTWYFAQRESLREVWERDPAQAEARLRRRRWYGLAAGAATALTVLPWVVYLLTSARPALGVSVVFLIPMGWFGVVWLAYVLNTRDARAWERERPLPAAEEPGPAAGS